MLPIKKAIYNLEKAKTPSEKLDALEKVEKTLRSYRYKLEVTEFMKDYNDIITDDDGYNFTKEPK